MGLEEARQAIEILPSQTGSSEGSEAGASGSDNGGLAPDSSSQSSEVLDLSKTEKFLWEGKEMTPDELRKSFLRQQDYTKKTQAVAEERRRFDEERRSYNLQREETEKYESNLDADIQNVLRDPSLEAKFKEIYPEKYHGKLEQSLNQAFGDQNSPNRSQALLERRLQSIEGKFQSQDRERAKTAFESEVSKDAEILDSAISRLSAKYPMADEDSILARAQYMAADIKKDADFQKNFSGLMEKLYKENHQFHEKRYQTHYKSKVDAQKQANTRGKDIGRGGATPGAAPVKMKLKDVKNHILSNFGN